MIKIDKKYIWIWLGLGAILLRIIFAFVPQLGEWLYRTIVFPLVRLILDNTLGYLPFAGIYLLLGIGLLYVIYYFFFSGRKKPTIRQRVLNGLSVVGFFVFWFMLLWGFHYPLPTIKQLTHLTSESKPDIVSFYRSTLVEAEMNRNFVQGGPITESMLPDKSISKIREQVKRVIEGAGIPAYTNVNCRETANGFIRRFSIHGFYMPFSGEGIVDGSLTTIPRIFTIAHEMSHGYGVTNEGEANFVAYVALKNTNDPALNYIADFVLFRHLLREVSNQNPEVFEELYGEIPESILQDVDFISRDVANYEDFFPEFSSRVNNAYLMAQGVEGGAESYNDLIQLVNDWNQRNRSLTIKKE